MTPAAATQGLDTTKPVQLLWTGGWDSSFRLMQSLLVERRPVQPIYVLMAERRTALLELQAMERMRDALHLRLADPRLLRPLHVLLASDYPPDEWQKAIYDSIARRTRLGTQYLALAGVAEALGWRGVELSAERSATPDGLVGWSRMVFDSPGVLGTSPEGRLFRYWSWPTIGLLKEEMRDIAQEHDFLGLLMRHRWFCHDPVLGKPCGRCHPCHLAIQDDVAFAHRLVSTSRAAVRKAGRVARTRRRAITGA